MRIISNSVSIEVLVKRGEDERSILGQAGSFKCSAVPGGVNKQLRTTRFERNKDTNNQETEDGENKTPRYGHPHELNTGGLVGGVETV